VWGRYLWEGRGNEGDGEGTWWLNFIYIHEIEHRNFLELLQVRQNGG
jgi:hypothetical protein